MKGFTEAGYGRDGNSYALNRVKMESLSELEKRSGLKAVNVMTTIAKSSFMEKMPQRISGAPDAARASLTAASGERARGDFGAIGAVNEGEDCQHGVADEFEHFNRHGFAPRPSWRRNNR